MGNGYGPDGDPDVVCSPGGRNIRSVWNIATQPYPGAHYATFPPALIYPCIKAGTSERGVCEACGAPWERVVERKGSYEERKANGGGGPGNVGVSDSYQNACHAPGVSRDLSARTRTVGWQPTCSCNGHFETRKISKPVHLETLKPDEVEEGAWKGKEKVERVYVPAIPLSEHPVVPATVLDPFLGSGTTALAARKLGRRSIGFDLDQKNIKQIEERLGTQGVLL